MKAPRRVRGAVLVILLALLSPCFAYATDIVVDGEHTYTEDLRIRPGEVVRVKSGAVLQFGPGVGIKVEGALDIRGTVDERVMLKPSGGNWEGIASAPGGSVRLVNAALDNADEAVRMSGGVLYLENVSVDSCTEGVVLETMADAEILNTRFYSIAKTALTLRQGARATVNGCEFAGPGKDGIKTVGRCSVDVSDSSFTGLGKAVRSTYPGSRPKLAGCTIEDNEYGVYSEYPDSGAVAEDCSISGNIFGVYAKKMSSPEVNGSRIMDNKHGVYVTEGATPRVTGTMISGNEYGVYVTFSSYPVINRCEFAANKAYAVYLDEQSYEWVSNTGDDTRREKMGMRAAATGGSGGRAGQHAAGSGQSGSGLEREKAMSAERYVNPRGAFVDFRENHWGAVATKEMSGSGELVDTGVIYDYFDLNSDIYEGKRWVRDKADYTGYLKASPLKR